MSRLDTDAVLDELLNELMMEDAGLADMVDDDDAGDMAEDLEDEVNTPSDSDDDEAEAIADALTVDSEELDGLDDELSDMADDDDVDDLSIEDLERELKDDTYISDEDREGATLTPDEEKLADDMMQTAGTACLIKSEMDDEDRKDLLESASDLRTAIIEGFLTESMIQDIKDYMEGCDIDSLDDDLFEEKTFKQKTRVIFNKQARMRQLFSVAVNISARAHNDPTYKKYQKICTLRKAYKKKLQTKYRAEATKRMRVMFARLKKSKSPILNKLGNKAGGKKKSNNEILDRVVAPK